MQGVDQVFAVQTCEQKCDQARLLPDAARDTFYCGLFFNIDKNNNGLADRIGEDDTKKDMDLKKYYCKKK